MSKMCPSLIVLQHPHYQPTRRLIPMADKVSDEMLKWLTRTNLVQNWSIAALGDAVICGEIARWAKTPWNEYLKLRRISRIPFSQAPPRALETDLKLLSQKALGLCPNVPEMQLLRPTLST